ncbi:hypothetical protein SERLA73DRAFT_187958 [Serpula lacrymans var. lacrymans S7.3]|uniref:Uncharacterized protein n=1 Tax=Serpula lacrymans var. lacrymans (strain S7.3) TaxID=936435 RepID=F8Q9X0_SERL3|nr:hypothetical protein SERLA73DRAFT_187958 [Serpula lacrymans var. lacrymans S7.3]
MGFIRVSTFLCVASLVVMTFAASVKSPGLEFDGGNNLEEGSIIKGRDDDSFYFLSPAGSD